MVEVVGSILAGSQALQADSLNVIVNVAAALVLLLRRKGDTNMRAVWLFSRNDAIGNLAVVVAAVLV